MGEKKKIASFQELLANLEPVELSALQSDIPENAYFEVKRIRRNVSAMLAFLYHSMLPANGEERAVAEEVRHECLVINKLISHALLLYRIPLFPEQLFVRRIERLSFHYRVLVESTYRLCMLANPALASDLDQALQMAE